MLLSEAFFVSKVIQLFLFDFTFQGRKDPAKLVECKCKMENNYLDSSTAEKDPEITVVTDQMSQQFDVKG